MDIKQVKGCYYGYETYLELKVQLCNPEIQSENNVCK